MLDHLELLVVVDNETDTLSSVDPGVSQLPEMASLLDRLPAEGAHGAVCVFDHLCVACHGLSVQVTGRLGDEVRTILFDVGPYPDTWLANAARHDLDLSRIETVFLSHWHADHSGGFPTVADSPIRCTSLPQNRVSLSSTHDKCAPRSSSANAWISSMMTA